MMLKTIRPHGKEDDPLELLRMCRGYYECPIDPSGKRLGPLVGYAGKDKVLGKQYVGNIYANFAKAERHGPVLDHFAKRLIEKIFATIGVSELSKVTGFCGAPEGGKALANAMAISVGSQYVYPEKKVTKVASGDAREESEFRFDRHEIEPGSRWILVEDVANNFSSTVKMIELIESHGGTVVAIACFLNRSLSVDTEFEVREGLTLPVISLVRKPIDQWAQNDTAVVDDIAAGNVIWKPKNDWAPLEKAMLDASLGKIELEPRAVTEF